ncbi:hypothetical protein AURDEDRAFT_174294 [Auricularia subglabra TFB-10046 SS5]|nr:hypothetical protein AURDEDRAFT_174294 [Auricularia subglabra TFB-10046 SS5]
MTAGTSVDLYKLLQTMPNLQDLLASHVPGDYAETVTPPPCRLRTFSYLSSLQPGASWHLPLLNSSRSLRTLRLMLVLVPPAESMLAAAELIGPSVEVVSLHGAALLPEVAGVLIPRCTRLRSLTIGSIFTSCNVAGVVDLITYLPCTPLHELRIRDSMVMVRLAGQVVEAGFPPSLRALRRLHCDPQIMRYFVADSYRAVLSRVCALRRIRLVVQDIGLID